jgi:hypothetical protein
MSYDFRLFLPEPGVDPLVTAQDVREDESLAVNPGAIVPAKEARKRSLAEALIQSDPDLTIFQFGFNQIAEFEGISIEEAKQRYRHFELNGRADGPGIQIMLFDDEASLTVPYWHKGQKATAVFAQIWGYLGVIQDVAGYKIYDPQLERIIDLATDLNVATDRYSKVVDSLW